MTEKEMTVEKSLGKDGADWVHAYADALIQNGFGADSDKSDSEIIRLAYDLAVEARRAWQWKNEPFADSPENPF